VALFCQTICASWHLKVKVIIKNTIEFKNLVENNKRLLSIDYGANNIGLAISDRNQSISNPYLIIKRKGHKKDIEYILAIIRDLDIGGIILGWPTKPNGDESDICKLIQSFMSKLLLKYDIPIYLQDEFYSSMDAEQILKQLKVPYSKRDSMGDKVAASIILQSFLDQCN
jgi:putative holliday junction resolvase